MPTEPKDRIILPLDFHSRDEALSVVDQLKDHVGMFKIGLTLFMSAEGTKIIQQVHKMLGGGERIFLDIKFSDIPHTVRGVSSAVVSKTEVKYFTVNAQQGERALRAAVEAMQNRTNVLAVTVLTSTSEAESEDLGYVMPVSERVVKYAEMARKAGCAGAVCSGLEARAVKEKCGSHFVVVTPGIRPKTMRVEKDDQRRVLTPGEAIRNGSDYLVIGRPIYQAGDPVYAAQAVAEEIRVALELSS
ncbi:MAG: orotidine-5'-phosphate decarboxylase [Nitrospiria bacterium]